MNNAEEFLSYFNQIESYLRKRIGKESILEDHTTFLDLVYRVSKTNRIIERYANDLKEFAELRNAIIHQRTDGHIIATPLNRTVTEIKSIYELITKPPIAVNIKNEPVNFLSSSDPLSKALKMVDEYSFSQIPIYRDGVFKALLSSNTITRWLASQIKDDLISISETKISDVLKFSENKNNFKLFHRNANCFEVLEIFQSAILSGNNLEAVIITDSGKSDEKPLRIFTVWDIPLLEKRLKK